LVTLVDHATKVVVGWAVGARKTTEVALQAWERAKQTLATRAGSWHGMIVHHDQDPVCLWGMRGPSGYSSTRRFESPTRYAGLGGTPRWKRSSADSRQRTDRLLLDCQTLDELTTLIAQRIDYYNRDRQHSRIGYVAPLNLLCLRAC
jgi:transposase InsO family protein